MGFRQNVYTEGTFGYTQPVFRQAVVPGQSVEFDLTCKWLAKPFTSPVMFGGIAQLALFYVPHRLTWSGWVDFATDRVGTPPAGPNAWNAVFDRNVGNLVNFSYLYRQAFRLAHNEFFGQEDIADSWYASVTNNSLNTLRMGRTLDQFYARLKSQTNVEAPAYIATVAGATASIDLNDFRAALSNASARRRQDMTGQKYVDALRRMGVDLDWRVQEAPELLGHVKAEFQPQSSQATSAPLDGGNSPFSRYSGTLQLQTSRRYFAEHGYIVGILLIRPHSFNNDLTMPPDGIFLREHADFYFGDEGGGAEKADLRNFAGGAVAADVYLPRWEWYLSGNNLRGNTGVGWNVTSDGASIDRMLYPTFNNRPTSQGSITGDYAVGLSANNRLITPIKRDVM